MRHARIWQRITLPLNTIYDGESGQCGCSVKPVLASYQSTLQCSCSVSKHVGSFRGRFITQISLNLHYPATHAESADISISIFSAKCVVGWPKYSNYHTLQKIMFVTKTRSRLEYQFRQYTRSRHNGEQRKPKSFFLVRVRSSVSLDLLGF